MARTRAAAQKQNTVVDERGISVTRVFHPNADTYHDVDTDRVAEWHEQGWTVEPTEGVNNVENYPELVDYSDAPADTEPPA